MLSFNGRWYGLRTALSNVPYQLVDRRTINRAVNTLLNLRHKSRLFLSALTLACLIIIITITLIIYGIVRSDSNSNISRYRFGYTSAGVPHNRTGALVLAQGLQYSWFSCHDRTFDIAGTLVSHGYDTYLMDNSIAPELRSNLLAKSIGFVPLDDLQSALSVKRPGSNSTYFGVVLMYFWMWGDMGYTIPEHYTPMIRHQSPESIIVVITDDIQSIRLQQMNHAFRELMTSVQLQQMQLQLNIAMEKSVYKRELSIYNNADHVVTISRHDARLLNRLLSPTSPHNTSVQRPHSTDVSFNSNDESHLFPSYIPQVWPVTWGHNITNAPIPDLASLHPFHMRDGCVFLGNLKNPTSQLAVYWFFARVYPLLAIHIRTSPITLIGAVAPEFEIMLRALIAPAYQKQLIVHSYLSDTEVLKHLQQARIMVAPIVASTGVNTKVLYGLAGGVPVVCTPTAARGIDLSEEDKRDSLVIANDDTPEAYAAAVELAYSDSALWTRTLTYGLTAAHKLVDPAAFQQDMLKLILAVRMQTGDYVEPVHDG